MSFLAYIWVNECPAGLEPTTGATSRGNKYVKKNGVVIDQVRVK